MGTGDALNVHIAREGATCSSKTSYAKSKKAAPAIFKTEDQAVLSIIEFDRYTSKSQFRPIISGVLKIFMPKPFPYE